MGIPLPQLRLRRRRRVNTSMDDVVAGTGAIATSQTPGFEGVGTRFPATCVGAIQASAEWSQKIFGSTERRDFMFANEDVAIGFFNEIGVAPGAFRLDSTIGEDFYTQMLSGQFEGLPRPVVFPRVQDGVVQVLQCSPDTDKTAVMRVAMPVENPVNEEMVGNGSGVRYGWLVRTYQLQVVDGSWRLVHLLDPRDQGIYHQMMNASGNIDLDKELPVLIQRPATDEARQIVSRTLFLSQNVHYFQNKNGEWGQAS